MDIDSGVVGVSLASEEDLAARLFWAAGVVDQFAGCHLKAYFILQMHCF